MKPFHFKQFQIIQEKAAMKIGTDGVLLGAWANLVNAKTILDIGTGTGVIAIMAAQRNEGAQIQAIEIDEIAVIEATENANSSPWSQRIKVHSIALQHFQPENNFDHIITNPPFFVESKLTDPTDSRSFARQQISMPPNLLAESVASLLTENGKCSIIYPVDRFKEIQHHFTLHNLHLTRKWMVYGRPNIPAKRVLAEWSKQPQQLEQNELIIEEFGRHKYSKMFTEITKDFYLNF